MGFTEDLMSLSERAAPLLGVLETEEATKNALVMPFIQALGYNVFDPQEVIPEFTADVGIKKGEKVDYAIVRDGSIAMLVECKKAGANLKEANRSQLFRYFTVTNARIAILTNGTHFQVFSDLDTPNKMDDRPYLEFDLLNPRKENMIEIRKLRKGGEAIDDILADATSLLYLKEIRNIITAELERPSDEFTKFFFTAVNQDKRFVQSLRDSFRDLVKTAFNQVIGESVSDRLMKALKTEEEASAQPEDDSADEVEKEDSGVKDGVETTDEELEGFQIVRAIASEVIEPARIVHRDSKSYFAINVDDNSRKPLCRLHFNRKQKYIGLLDENKNETREPIEVMTDLFKHRAALTEAAKRYL